MAYFSNGSEGDIYEHDYCHNCLNYSRGACSILLIHAIYNYDQCRGGKKGEAIKSILNILIPRSEDGLTNMQCSMIKNKDLIK